MTQEEELLVQNKLNQIIDKLGISEEQFQRSTMYHGQDQHKGMQIMQMQQQTQGMGGDHQALSREKTISTFKAQQEIQLEQMDEMLKDGMNEPRTPEAQMEMMMKMVI